VVTAGAATFTAGATAAVGMAGSGLSLAVAPLAGMFIAAPLEMALENQHLEHEDRSMIELTILERGTHLALEIPPDREKISSVFFPLTPGPARLLVGYRIADQPRELAVPLPALAKLHLRPKTESP